jgi:hypothetical protein
VRDRSMAEAAAFVDFRALVAEHPPREACLCVECQVCGVRDCPFEDEDHYRVGGCPSEVRVKESLGRAARAAREVVGWTSSVRQADGDGGVA